MPSMAASHGGILYYVVKVPKAGENGRSVPTPGEGESTGGTDSGFLLFQHRQRVGQPVPAGRRPQPRGGRDRRVDPGGKADSVVAGERNAAGGRRPGRRGRRIEAGSIVRLAAEGLERSRQLWGQVRRGRRPEKRRLAAERRRGRGGGHQKETQVQVLRDPVGKDAANHPQVLVQTVIRPRSGGVVDARGAPPGPNFPNAP